MFMRILLLIFDYIFQVKDKDINSPLLNGKNMDDQEKETHESKKSSKDSLV